MASSSFIGGQSGGLPTTIIVQGFRGGGQLEEPYVFIGVQDSESDIFVNEVSLTAEAANILGEELRKHAEFALSVREQENV